MDETVLGGAYERLKKSLEDNLSARGLVEDVFYDKVQDGTLVTIA